MSIAFVFPGQGAQYVGMGKALAQEFAAARETFQEADEALAFSLSRIFLEGPEDELRLTYYTQPAILAVSIACLRAFATQSDIAPSFVAGHSLGEYSALVAASALSFADALRLVHLRGRYMDEAVPAGVGGMAAVLGADSQLLVDLCQDVSTQLGKRVEIANFNCPGQLVVSGDALAVGELVNRASEAKSRRAVRLEVSGPFHSSLMEPAKLKLTDRLQDVTIGKPEFPVVTNVSGNPIQTPKDIREALAKQVACPVLWESSVHEMMAHGVTTFIEFGPGTVLSGLIRKTNKSAKTLHVEDPPTLMETIGVLSGEGASA